MLFVSGLLILLLDSLHVFLERNHIVLNEIHLHVCNIAAMQSARMHMYSELHPTYVHLIVVNLFLSCNQFFQSQLESVFSESPHWTQKTSAYNARKSYSWLRSSQKSLEVSYPDHSLEHRHLRKSQHPCEILVIIETWHFPTLFTHMLTH